jgi:hypothetical protein
MDDRQLKTYEVRISYQGVSTYFVEAANEEKAAELVLARYLKGEPEEATGSEYEEIVDVTTRLLADAHPDEATPRAGSQHGDDGAGRRPITLEETIGRTVARIEAGRTEGAYVAEPTITFHFADGTHHTIVLPADAVPNEEDTIDYTSKRVGTAHKEDIVGGRARCRICGWIDEADPSDPVVREWHGDSFEEAEDETLPTGLQTVECKLCHNQVPIKTAHLHQDGYVGECCWDERLRSTE